VHPDPEGAESALSTALEETVRMGRLVDDLLLLARLDAAAPRRTAPVDLAEVVREVAPAVAPHARLDVVPALVLGDGDALGRVVRNLVENAARHATSEVRVAVSADEHVELVVDDDGPGIPESERERVFDRFHRVDSPRSRGRRRRRARAGHRPRARHVDGRDHRRAAVAARRRAAEGPAAPRLIATGTTPIADLPWARDRHLPAVGGRGTGRGTCASAVT
jgi:hypothetical protein